MQATLDVRWDTAENFGWDLLIHVGDGGSLLVASIDRELIDDAAPGVQGSTVGKAEAIRDKVEAAIASAYRHARFSTVYEAGSAFAMHRALMVKPEDFATA